MDREKIEKLENWFFEISKKPALAAERMEGLIGVLVGLKPVTAGVFVEDELERIDLYDFKNMVKDLQLRVVFYHEQTFFNNKLENQLDFYVSKDIEVAGQAHDVSIDLWSSMDDYGEKVHLAQWKKATKKIGELLGYPKTAIDNFLEEGDIDNEERKKRMERNLYYVHSEKFENEEYESYDKILNEAIKKYAPKTTDYLLKNKSHKRGWSA